MRETKPERSSLMSAFARAPYRFSFYQAVRILQDHFGTSLTRHRQAPSTLSPIRFKPDNSMTFPSADLKSVELDDELARVVVTFMGLYGAASPLPPVFSEDTTTNGEALRDFLDIFNDRFCAFFFEAWERNRPELESEEYNNRVLALGGVDVDSLDPFSLEEIVPFVGVLGATSRNPAGLEALVSGLTGISAVVRENEPRWVTITEPPGLGPSAGTSFRLGESSTLGRFMPDASGKFSLELGPLTLDQYRELLPGRSLSSRIIDIVDLYVQDDLAFDACLQLNANEVTSIQLGNRAFELGLNTWVGKPTTRVAERTVAYKG